MTKENKTIHALLHEVQTKLKAPKNQYNKFGGYKYRSCEDILEGVKAVLPEDCHITVSDSIELVGDRFYIKATAQFTYGQESILTTAYAREEQQKKGMDSAQLTGATSSYARKYALNGLFCIDDTKDADSQDNSEQPAKPASKAKAAPKKQEKKLTPEQKLYATIKKEINDSPNAEILQHVWKSFADNGDYESLPEKGQQALSELYHEKLEGFKG